MDKLREELLASMKKERNAQKEAEARAVENLKLREILNSVYKDLDVDPEDVDNLPDFGVDYELEIVALRVILKMKTKKILDLDSDLEAQRSHFNKVIELCDSEYRALKEKNKKLSEKLAQVSAKLINFSSEQEGQNQVVEAKDKIIKEQSETIEELKAMNLNSKSLIDGLLKANSDLLKGRKF